MAGRRPGFRDVEERLRALSAHFHAEDLEIHGRAELLQRIALRRQRVVSLNVV